MTRPAAVWTLLFFLSLPPAPIRAFASLASNLVPDDTNGTWDVFVYERAPSGAQNGRVACASNGGQLVSFAPDGSEPTPLTSDGVNGYPTWSRDGTRILFSRKDDGRASFEIWRMDADGGNPRPITTGTPPGGGNFTPFESPDGRRIAFTAYRPDVGHQEVWIVDADGRKPRRLTTTPVNSVPPTWSVHPTWSADGRRIVYASTRSGSTQIWTMDPHGRRHTQVTDGNGPAYPHSNVPEWSFDGRRIVFWSGIETQYGEVWVMDPDGSNRRRITETPDPMNSDNPHWSPDGARILFASNRGGRGTDVWMVDAAGGEPRLFAADMNWCTWQPLGAN